MDYVQKSETPSQVLKSLEAYLHESLFKDLLRNHLYTFLDSHLTPDDQASLVTLLKNSGYSYRAANLRLEVVNTVRLTRRSEDISNHLRELDISIRLEGDSEAGRQVQVRRSRHSSYYINIQVTNNLQA
jgi:vesicle coat complex subunit